MAASADRRLIAGRYALGAVLGRGGMGVVWRAEDVLLDRPVAVKEVELPAGLPDHERAEVRERALREARAAARLGHPSVVTLHDAVDATGRLFLVMELVDAPTLRDLVAGVRIVHPVANQAGQQGTMRSRRGGDRGRISLCSAGRRRHWPAAQRRCRQAMDGRPAYRGGSLGWGRPTGP